MMQSSEPCHLIGCDKKSEIVQYFQGRLWDKNAVQLRDK